MTPYTLISSDCHAGASHDTYRGYLEERYLDDFDAWRDFDLEQLAPLAAQSGPTPAEIAVPLDEIPTDSVSPAFTR